jgi:hypothetical protein
MKGDIGFAGFLLTADEWQELDTEARAALIAVATRRVDPWLATPIAPSSEPLAEGSGPFEIEEISDADLEPANALTALAADALTREDPFADVDDAPLTRALDREA